MFAALVLVVLTGFVPAYGQLDHAPKVQVGLIAEQPSVAPGGSVTVAFEQNIRPGWHTYWINPGEAGAPTTINWSLPQGWQAGPIAWPYPARLPVGPLMDYGYRGKVWLLVHIHAPRSARPGERVSLRATGHWLVCKQVCIPEEGTAALPLAIAAAAPTPDPAAQAEFAAARAKIPQASPWPVVYRAADKFDLYLKAPQLVSAHPVKAAFFPLSQGIVKGIAPQRLGFAHDGIVLQTDAGSKFSETAFRAGEPEVSGVLVLTAADGSVKPLLVRAPPGEVPAAVFVTPRSAGGIGLWLALLFAFLGGLILNLMPCVLPVLAMKVVAVATAAHGRRAAGDGLAYGAGAILSFLALGVCVAVLRAGGSVIGWGFQLQNPVVVAGFALLMFAVGLNLSGVFELSSGINAGATLTRRGGIAGAFFTGVLAVAVAAPCTAPFMAVALGYALMQPIAIAFGVFLALGIGFAAPFVIIGLSPRLLRFVPRPGAWMLRFRQVLAFPMYGAAVWLVWVLALEAGAGAVAAVLAAMVLFAFAAWVWSASRSAAARWRGAGAWLAILGIAVALGMLWFGGHLASAVGGATAIASAQTEGLGGQPYTPQRLAALRAQGRPVFVNATAAWCITCLVNEKIAFSSTAVKQVFAEKQIAYLVADWTNQNPAITRLLQANGRSGVPLYLYYAPGAVNPRILPQVLTPGMVLSVVK